MRCDEIGGVSSEYLAILLVVQRAVLTFASTAPVPQRSARV